MDLRSSGALVYRSVVIRVASEIREHEKHRLSASAHDLVGSSHGLHRNGGPIGRTCDFSLLPSQLVEGV